LGALLMHAFAVCLAAVFLVPEAVWVIKNRHLRVPMALAIILPVLMAGLVYLPVSAGFKSFGHQVEAFQTVIVPSNFEASIGVAYQSLFAPCVTVLFIAAALLVIRCFNEPTCFSEERAAIPAQDIILAAALLLMPIVAACVGLIERSLFYPRYVNCTVAGASIILGFGAGFLRRRNYAGIAIATALVLVTARNFATPLHKRLSGYVLNPYSLGDALASYTPAGNPLALHDLLKDGSPDLPILTPSLRDFVYIEYNSQALQPRMHYMYSRLPNYGASWINGFRETYQTAFTAPISTDELVGTSPRWLYYGTLDGYTESLLEVVERRASVSWFKTSRDGTHFLAELEFRTP
jgi:hypothetical protein